jgi:hypothetical protein
MLVTAVARTLGALVARSRPEGDDMDGISRHPNGFDEGLIGMA